MTATVDDLLLCRLTGELWAVFAPWRGPWTGGGAAAAYLARRSFRSGAGLRWRHQGRDRDERDENVEALGRLERRGLLTRRVEKTKVIATRLLDAGIERACSLAGAPCWLAGRDVCERLAALDDQRATMVHLGTRWTAEWALAGTPARWAGCGRDEVGRANRRRLSVLEERAIPALVRGWLISGADLDGRVWYSLTGAGRAALTEAPGDVPPVIEIDADGDCSLAWREGAHAMQIRLAAAPRSEREIGLMPLPAHGGPVAGRDVGPRGDVPTMGGRNYARAAHLATEANVGGGEAKDSRSQVRSHPSGPPASCGGDGLAQVRDLRAEAGDLVVQRGEFWEDEAAYRSPRVQVRRDEVQPPHPGLVADLGHLPHTAEMGLSHSICVDRMPGVPHLCGRWFSNRECTDHGSVAQLPHQIVHLPRLSSHQSPPSEHGLHNPARDAALGPTTISISARGASARSITEPLRIPS